MTPQQINYCEIRFTMIDRKLSHEDITSYMYHESCNFEMKIYVDWLLNRWIFIRNNIDDYPKQINHNKLIVKQVRFNID